jgi:transcriptional regulator with XRE-family HTH domain
MMNLEKIKDLCHERKISMRSLASDLGISEQALHGLIKRNSARKSTLTAICRYFGVDISYFVRRIHEKLQMEPDDYALINDRLRAIITSTRKTQKEFAEAIGIQPTRLSNILRIPSDFGVDVVRGIALAYPKINLHWLLLGYGEMLRDQDPNKQITVVEFCPKCEGREQTEKALNKYILNLEKQVTNKKPK